MRFLALLCTLVVLGQPAAAGLNVCNKGTRTARVAVGRFNGTQWMSEGWWHVKAHECAELVQGKLDARYYYMYATDDASGTWDGGKGFCTAPGDKFQIAGRGQCAARGYERRGFFEIDTANQLTFTQALSD